MNYFKYISLSNLYSYLIEKLPYKFMYKHVQIDSLHKMWIPRFGYSKKQIKESEQYAEEISRKINWD